MFHSKCCGDICKDLDCKIDNQGENLVVTVSGDKDKIKKVEKKLNALRELHCDC